MVEANPLFRITDGTTYIDLLGVAEGFLIDDWTPAIAPLKGGGTYQSSALSDGKQLVSAKFDTAVETIAVKVHGGSQDTLIRDAQNILRLLEKARDYWTTKFQKEPVYIEARGPYETNTRYAVIHNYTIAQLDNPYRQPFFSCIKGALDEVTIALERGHWTKLPPRQSECVPLIAMHGFYDVGNFNQEYQTYFWANADDWYTALDSNGVKYFYNNTSTLRAGVSEQSPTWFRYSIGLRFGTYNIGDPKTARIMNSWLSIIETDSNLLDKEYYFRINAEAAISPAACTSYDDHMSRKRTAAYVDWVVTPAGAGTWHWTPNLSAIWEELLDIDGWQGGTNDKVIFFIEPTGCIDGKNHYVDFAAQENVTYDSAWMESALMLSDAEASCDKMDVFVADECQSSQWIDAVQYDDGGGGAFSANLVDYPASFPVAILPATPALNDVIYFHSWWPFSTLMFDVSTPQSGIEGVWEYWQGAPASAWTAIPSDRIDTTGSTSTTPFDTYGKSYFHFRRPYDTTNGSWATRSIDTYSTRYVIRFRVTAVSSPTPPYIQDYVWMISNAYECGVYVREGEVEGDIPALGAIVYGGEGQKQPAGTGALTRDRLIVAIRSARGPFNGLESLLYSPFFQMEKWGANDFDTHPVHRLEISYSSGQITYGDDMTATGGKCAIYNPTGTGTVYIRVKTNTTYYYGTFRAFARVRQTAAANAFYLKLKTESVVWNISGYDTLNETDEVFVGGPVSTATAPNWQLIDLGTLTIPANLDKASGLDTGDFYVTLQIRCESTTPDLHVNDIILMPSDEWICDARDITGHSLVDRFLMIDSVSSPRASLDVSAKYSLHGSSSTPLAWKAVGDKLLLPANTDFQIFFLPAKYDSTTGYWISDPGTLGSVRVFKNEQYLGMRGDR